LNEFLDSAQRTEFDTYPATPAILSFAVVYIEPQLSNKPLKTEANTSLDPRLCREHREVACFLAFYRPAYSALQPRARLFLGRFDDRNPRCKPCREYPTDAGENICIKKLSDERTQWWLLLLAIVALGIDWTELWWATGRIWARQLGETVFPQRAFAFVEPLGFRFGDAQ
jgi:hypothetical protein